MGKAKLGKPKPTVTPEMLALVAGLAYDAGQDNICCHIGCLAIWLQENPGNVNSFPDEPMITKERWAKADKFIWETHKLSDKEVAKRIGMDLLDLPFN